MSKRSKDKLTKAERSWNIPPSRKATEDREATKDRLTKERRSWNMGRIRGKNTTPEMAVRSMLHRMGYRFRLHVKIRVPEDIPFALAINPKEDDRGWRMVDGGKQKRKSGNPKNPRHPLPRRMICPDIV